MTGCYPPRVHISHDTDFAIELCRQYPLAHFITHAGEEGGPHATRIPVSVRAGAGGIERAVGHVNLSNPQARELDGRQCLLSFSGPDAYVSPFFRLSRDRGPTWDYAEVKIRGTVSVRDDREFFKTMVTELARTGEQTDAVLHHGRPWNTTDVSDDYIDRLRQYVCAFEISIDDVSIVRKFHQDFSPADAMSVATNLGMSQRQSSQAVASQIVKEARSR